MRWLVAGCLMLACALPARAEAQTQTSIDLTRPMPHTTNHAIVGLGMAIWSTTYLPGLLMGLLGDLRYTGCSGVDSAFEAPFGALAGAIALQSCNGPAADIAYGYAFGIGQIVGLLVAILGATAFRRPVYPMGWTRWTANGFELSF